MLRYQSQGITDDVNSAALPDGTLQGRLDGHLPAAVGITDDEPHPAQPARHQAAEER